MISTERLILRPVMMCDRFDIFDYSKNENIGRNAGWAPHSSIDETESILDDIFIGKDGIFSIILKERPKVIGTIGLTDDPARSNPSLKDARLFSFRGILGKRIYDRSRKFGLKIRI